MTEEAMQDKLITVELGGAMPFIVAFRVRRALLETMKRNSNTRSNTMNEYTVICFDSEKTRVIFVNWALIAMIEVYE